MRGAVLWQDPRDVDTILELRGVTKSFGGVRALRDVSFELRRARSTRWWARTARARPR